MKLDRKINLRLVLGALLALVLLYALYTKSPVLTSSVVDKDDYSNVIPGKDRSSFRTPSKPAVLHPVFDWVDHTTNYVPKGDKYRIIYSQSTKDRKYFHVDLAGARGYNVNIISHPKYKNKWIVVAQSAEYRDDINASEQITCIAEFVDGVLHCQRWPTALPLATSINGKCEGEWGYTNLRRGPRDARVFYGPDQPYIIWGSQSHITCLGLWIQNLWMLLDGAKHPDEGFARAVTEIQRPEPWSQIEKNYFLFWDNTGQVYAHYDIWPRRVYSALSHDGGVMLHQGGPNIGHAAAERDQTCMDKLFPKLEGEQGLHQGTNSLSITMCKRSDPACVESDENTFVVHIMQRKTFADFHASYEPFPVLIKRTTPFELHAVAQKPLYYHGIEELTEKSSSQTYLDHKDWPMPHGHDEMYYTVSIAWKDNKQTNHGYLDDLLLIGFGVEDTRCAAIDVLASDILQDLAYC